MGKIDSLLKKVEFFEKMAVYGDRREFLKKFAQRIADTDEYKEDQAFKEAIEKAKKEQYSTALTTQNKSYSEAPDAPDAPALVAKDKPAQKKPTILEHAEYWIASANNLLSSGPEKEKLKKIVNNLTKNYIPALERVRKQNPQKVENLINRIWQQAQRLQKPELPVQTPPKDLGGAKTPDPINPNSNLA